MTVLGDRAFKEIIKLKSGCKGRPESNLTAVLIIRESLDIWMKFGWKFGYTKSTREVDALKKARVIQQKGGHMQTKERSLRKRQSCWHLDLTSVLQNLRCKCLLLEPSSLLILCYGSLRWVSIKGNENNTWQNPLKGIK